MNTDNNKIVYKSNELIQKFKNTFSLQEMKVINFLIANIDSPKYDSDFNEISVSLRELALSIGYKVNPKTGKITGSAYNDIKKCLQNLSNKTSDYFEFVDSDGKKYETYVRWLNKAKFNHTDHTVILKLDDDLKPYLLNLQKNYTKYELLNIVKMNSKYSVKLYELLKSWEKTRKGIKTFEMSKLQEYLEVPKSYNDFNLFKNKVLKIALKEINDITDLLISYDTEKKGKKVMALTFHISKKEIKELPPVIDMEQESILVESSNDEVVNEPIIDLSSQSFDWIDTVLKDDQFINISRLNDIDPNISDKRIKYIFDLMYNILEKEDPIVFNNPEDNRSIEEIVGYNIALRVRKILAMGEISNKYNYLIKMLENEYK